MIILFIFIGKVMCSAEIISFVVEFSCGQNVSCVKHSRSWPSWSLNLHFPRHESSAYKTTQRHIFTPNILYFRIFININWIIIHTPHFTTN